MRQETGNPRRSSPVADRVARHGEASDSIRVVAQARTATDLKRMIKESACDVIVLDLVLDDGSDPAETVAELVASGYRVLVYSIADNPRLVRRALAAGAHGMSRKSDSLAETADKIRQVARGH